MKIDLAGMHQRVVVKAPNVMNLWKKLTIRAVEMRYAALELTSRRLHAISGPFFLAPASAANKFVEARGAGQSAWR